MRGGGRKGGDRDAHGCVHSAGFTWCAAQRRCIRWWEQGSSYKAVAENCTAAALDAPSKLAQEGEKCCWSGLVGAGSCTEKYGLPDCAAGLHCETGEALWIPGQCKHN